MSEKTNISWADSTWNPWRGCAPVAAGCKNCYACTLVNRFGGDFSKRVRSKDATFYAPLRWNKRPWVCDLCCKPHSGITENGLCPVCWTAADAHRRRVFVESLGDFWDETVPIEWLADALDVIRRCPDLLFLIPSKRCKNWQQRMRDIRLQSAFPITFWEGEPPSNIWLGASISTQEDADREIPHLLAIPAAKHFLSVEPMLEPINLGLLGTCPKDWGKGYSPIGVHIDLVICGGESGPGYRDPGLDCARDLLIQCRAAGVKFWFKQSAGLRPGMGDTLDGVKIQEWPE